MDSTHAKKELTILRYLQEAQQNGDDPDRSIFRALGVEPVINCRGTFTIIGGSVERPEALAAYKEASRHFVQYDELAEGVGRRLAEITGAEWGMIPDGCAAGLKHVTAACVTGGNPEKLIRIPDLTGFEKTQVVAPRYARNSYDHAVRNIGVEMITVDTPEELARAIGPKTAMIYLTSAPASEAGEPLSLEAIVARAKPAGVPVLIDAAAENLSIPCIHLERGADVVAYSGGKAMCGPQGAGLLLGNKKILTSAWQASSPHHGPNRDNKISREEILAMLAAVEAWVARDHGAEWDMWLDRLAVISRRAEQVEGVSTSIEEPAGRTNVAPVLVIEWDPNEIPVSGEQAAEDFARNRPRVAIGSSDRNGRASLRVTPSQMQPGNEDVVAERVHAYLSKARGQSAASLVPAAVDISGHWDLTVEYSSSTSHHRLFLHQQDNWVEGTHQSDFSAQPITGAVQGHEVQLRSQVSMVGDRIPFLFGGRVENDVITGTIHLGEYLTAGFTARRTQYENPRTTFLIPGGPPLAT